MVASRMLGVRVPGVDYEALRQLAAVKRVAFADLVRALVFERILREQQDLSPDVRGRLLAEHERAPVRPGEDFSTGAADRDREARAREFDRKLEQLVALQERFSEVQKSLGETVESTRHEHDEQMAQLLRSWVSRKVAEEGAAKLAADLGLNEADLVAIASRLEAAGAG